MQTHADTRACAYTCICVRVRTLDRISEFVVYLFNVYICIVKIKKRLKKKNNNKNIYISIYAHTIRAHERSNDA